MKTTQIEHSSDATIPTFESVRESLRETDRIIQELNETQKETGRIIMKNVKLIGKLCSCFGIITAYNQQYPETRCIVRQF